MDRLAFRHALAARLGQLLTPSLCSEIEVEASRPVDRSIDLAQFLPYQTRGYLIQAERFATVLPELLPLHAEHWLETEHHRHEIALEPDYEAMAASELAGRLLQFTARRDGALVGGLRMFVTPSLHTKSLLAEEDTLFVSAAHRGGWLGSKLIAYAEDCLRLIGVREVYADSKLVNGADVLLRRRRYTPIATKFHKFL